jgi:hypothetical protein
MSGKLKRWGGARSGAGRPKKSTSARQLAKMERAARKWAKETGYDVDGFLLAVIGNDKEKIGATDIPLRDRITCAKIWKEYTMARISEQNVNVTKQEGQVIMLPPMKEDPALKIVKGGK